MATGRHARTVLADGTYDVIVIDARAGPASDGTPGLSLELTILAGEHKSEIVALHATGLPGDELDLMGMPGTLTVADGTPAFHLDP